MLTTWPHLVLFHAAVTAGTKVGRKAPGCYDSLLLLPLFLCLPFSEWPSICAHALWSWSAQIRLPSPYSVWVGHLVCWRGHTAKKQLAASLVLSNKVVLSKSKMVTKRILKIPCVVIELGQLRSHQKLSLLICVTEKLSDVWWKTCISSCLIYFCTWIVDVLLYLPVCMTNGIPISHRVKKKKQPFLINFQLSGFLCDVSTR